MYGNCESWKYLGQKIARDRLAPGRGSFFPTPWGKTVSLGDVKLMLIYIFQISYVHKKLLTHC